MAGSNVSTGAKLLLTIGDAKVGFANNVTFTVNHNHQPIEVFNEVTVNEYAELGATVEFTATMFRVATKAAISLGLMPRLADLLEQPELTATIFDKHSGVALLTMNGLKCQTRSGSVDARDFVHVLFSYIFIFIPYYNIITL